jgi:hypothetical protein
MVEIVALREEMTDGDVNIMSHDPNKVGDYLTLYTPRGTKLTRSVGHRKDQDIALEYNGLIFIVSPGYRDAVVVIEWDSLKSYVNSGNG